MRIDGPRGLVDYALSFIVLGGFLMYLFVIAWALW